MNIKKTLPSIIINLFIIRSLPPFLTFLIKLKSLNLIILINNNLIILIFLILSISTLIFYINILIKIKLTFIFKTKFLLSFVPQIKNKFLRIIRFIFLSISILFIINLT